MTALWINNPGFDTDHRHRGGMLTKTPPPTELQIPATVTTLFYLSMLRLVKVKLIYGCCCLMGIFNHRLY